MFDDQPAGNAPGGVPSNLPMGEPEDMFAPVEEAPASSQTPAAPHAAAPSSTPQVPPQTALGAGALTPKASVPPQSPPAAQAPPPTRGASTAKPMRTMPTGPGFEEHKIKGPSVLKSILLIIVIVVLGGAVGYAGWYAYVKFFAAPQGGVETGVTAPIPVEDTASVTGTEDVFDEDILFGSVIDDDGDGLDNTREQVIGTDPTVADTDGDGLSDGDEVTIWKTDPLDEDTDGDGYLDGEEVANGYNPAGPGRLPEVGADVNSDFLSEVESDESISSGSTEGSGEGAAGTSLSGCATNEACFLQAIETCVRSDISYAYRADLNEALGVTRDEQYLISLSPGQSTDSCKVDVILQSITITFDDDVVPLSSQAEIEAGEKRLEGRTASCESIKSGLGTAVRESEQGNLIDAIIALGRCTGSLL